MIAVEQAKSLLMTDDEMRIYGQIYGANLVV